MQLNLLKEREKNSQNSFVNNIKIHYDKSLFSQKHTNININIYFLWILLLN